MLSAAPRHNGQLRRPATRIPTVCVVDPRPEDYEDWDQLAHAKGAKLQIVASAVEALRLARTAPVDLWIVNAALPDSSGCELCSMLKAFDDRTPVFLVADEYSLEAERAAWAARATMFGVKPEHHAWFNSWAQQHAASRGA